MSAALHQAEQPGTGLRTHDPKRAAPGFTLFASAGGPTVYLIDLQGCVAHTWDMPFPAGHGYLTDRGTLVYNGLVATADAGFLSRSPMKHGAVLEVDWDGSVLWEVRHPDHHHDGRRMRNGNVLLLCLARIPDTLAARVRGGRPGSEDGGAMYGDYLVEMTTAGHVVWKWRSWEHLDPGSDSVANAYARSEWTHGNAVVELPDGNIIVTFRNLSTVAIVDRRSGEIIRKFGPPTLANQNAPTLLPNGNLLIIDKGTYRLHDGLPYWRVLEIDPCTNEAVWQGWDQQALNFFGARMSHAQRLRNGNTLMNEGHFGRIFEVTGEGEVAWEYINPFFNGTPSGQTNRVFRAYRYTPDEVSRARLSV